MHYLIWLKSLRNNYLYTKYSLWKEISLDKIESLYKGILITITITMVSFKEVTSQSYVGLCAIYFIKSELSSEYNIFIDHCRSETSRCSVQSAGYTIVLKKTYNYHIMKDSYFSEDGEEIVKLEDLEYIYPYPSDDIRNCSLWRIVSGVKANYLRKRKKMLRNKVNIPEEIFEMIWRQYRNLEQSRTIRNAIKMSFIQK